MLATRRKDLEAWAKALDARTDDEALARLRKIAARADRALSELSEISSALQDVPGDAGAVFREAYWKTTQGADALAVVVTAFRRHERG